jgi:hypothetical protein
MRRSKNAGVFWSSATPEYRMNGGLAAFPRARRGDSTAYGAARGPDIACLSCIGISRRTTHFVAGAPDTWLAFVDRRNFSDFELG